jgi:transcriptional repressor NrdR
MWGETYVRCPICGRSDTRVLESRAVEDDRGVRRRRECGACLGRFTTYERVEEAPLMVVKKDGRREAFDRQKILGGLLRACEKRPVSAEALQSLAEDVEREIRERAEREVPSSVIGELVMDRLYRLDGVAYVRFASVYRQFTDVQHFQSELERLRRKARQGAGEDTPGGTKGADL